MWVVWVDLSKGRHIPPRLLPLRKAASVVLLSCVDTAVGMWILLWGCGYACGSVDTPGGVWILPWGCGNSHGGVNTPVAVWILLGVCGYSRGDVDTPMGV